MDMPFPPRHHVDIVTVLANPRCPHCVQAVDRLTDWALEEGLPIAGLDLAAHPEAAAWCEAATSPILVFEGDRTVVRAGMVDHATFHRLAHPDP